MATAVSSTTRPHRPRGTLRAGIAGASGYAGRELTRLLRRHPHLRAHALQARSDGFDAPDAAALAACDVAFLALPHGESAALAGELVAAGTRVVDLGSDLRLVPSFAYGLPELFRADLAGAARVACPGCYATAALLALAPLAEVGVVDWPVAVDGKSGVSGAGRTPTGRTHLCEVEGGVAPYAPTGHRHIAEMEAALARLDGASPRVTFTPHLAPHGRGLEVTCYVRVRSPLDQASLEQLFRRRYAGEPFVTVTQAPHPGRLHGANACHLGAWWDERTGSAIVAAAIDNLVKGAAGQAVQCANLMLGLEETAGLDAEGLGP